MRYAISLSLVLVSAIFVSFVIEINEKMEVLSLSFARVPRNKLPNQASWAFYLPPLASLRRFYILVKKYLLASGKLIITACVLVCVEERMCARVEEHEHLCK